MTNNAIRIYSVFCLLSTAYCLLGCLAKPEPDPRAMIPMAGEGKILSLDQAIGWGTIEVKGQKMTFWWRSLVQTTARDGAGHAPELRSVTVPFNAEAGDSVEFRGYKMHGELFVTNARVVKK